MVETKGQCRKCGKEAILGDGLCPVCWDKYAENPRHFKVGVPFASKVEIRKLKKAGMSTGELARKFQISTRSVQRITQED